MARSNSVHPVRQACRAAYDRWALFATGRVGLVVMFAWAVAEATVWPVIPDFLLVPMAAVNTQSELFGRHEQMSGVPSGPRTSGRHLPIGRQVFRRRRFYAPLAAAIAGSALGGALLYALAYISPESMLDFVRHLPLVSGGQVAQAQGYLANEGVAGYLFQPWSGVPFKVWAVVGASMGLNPFLAIPTFIAGRAFRMIVFAVAARLVGGWFSALLRDYWLVVTGLYVVFFLVGLWQVLGMK